MNILLIDNYDSFTYNLAYMVRQITGILPVVRKNDELDMEEVAVYDKILLSPGPGIPAEAGSLLEVIRMYAPYKSILGICLGHQAIAEVFGAQLYNLQEVFHGIATPVHVAVPDILLSGLGDTFSAGRYHSWSVSREGLPSSLEIIAADGAGRIMALRHREYDVYGLQFHPESILTPSGEMIMNNWIRS
jgi:anthranilate synthase component 2